MSISQGAPCSHDEAFELIPWLVNGRLTPEEQDGLTRHMADCEDCRREVDAQHRLRNAIRRDESVVGYAPLASFQKLWLQIEGSGPTPLSDENANRDVNTVDAPLAPAGTPYRQRRWMAAAATILVVGLGLLTASQWRARSPGHSFEYRTAAAPSALPDREGQIRAVFSPTVTVEELTRIVSETRLTIVAGPSDSGVYTLAAQPGQSLVVADVIARLRSDPRVRFAEPVVAAPRGSP